MKDICKKMNLKKCEKYVKSEFKKVKLNASFAESV